MLRFVVLLALILVSGFASRARPRERRDLPPECDQTEFPKQCEQSPLEISFVVDASSSITSLNFERCLNFIQDFINKFNIGPNSVRMSLVTYAFKADAQTAINFGDFTDKGSLKDAIARTKYTAGGYTNTSAGIRHMLQHQEIDARANIRHVVIVITDGRSQDTEFTKQASQELHDLKNRDGKNVDVFAIGVGGGAFFPELMTIAGAAKNVFTAQSYETLGSLTQRLIYMSCAVVTTPECKMDPVELAFVIDSSSSIGDEEFAEGIDFVKSFSQEFKIDQHHVRVAAVTFDHNENADQAIQFNDYIDGPGLLRKLDAINYTRGGYTNTGAGITYMNTTLMANARPNTGKICIVMTDGESQDPWNTEDAAASARANNITMYAIGVGSVKRDELLRIAGDDSRIFNVSEYSQLNTFKQKLVDVTCTAALDYLAAHGENQKGEYKIDDSV